MGFLSRIPDGIGLFLSYVNDEIANAAPSNLGCTLHHHEGIELVQRPSGYTVPADPSGLVYLL